MYKILIFARIRFRQKLIRGCSTPYEFLISQNIKFRDFSQIAKFANLTLAKLSENKVQGVW